MKFNDCKIANYSYGSKHIGVWAQLPRKGQPLYKDKRPCHPCAHYLEVRLYSLLPPLKIWKQTEPGPLSTPWHHVTRTTTRRSTACKYPKLVRHGMKHVHSMFTDYLENAVSTAHSCVHKHACTNMRAHTHTHDKVCNNNHFKQADMVSQTTCSNTKVTIWPCTTDYKCRQVILL